MAAAALPLVEHAPPLPDRFADRELLQAVGLALELVDRAQRRSVALALNELGEIDLPAAAPASADDQALVRAIATLYLASQLELAGLISAVETFCGIAISGGIQADLGAATNVIAQFWKGRNERFHEKERRTFFTRLFGAETPEDLSVSASAINAGFDETMIGLCESLYKLDERALTYDYGSPQAQAKMRASARNVAANLLQRGTGIAAFAAQDIITTIQQCVLILQQREVQRAFMEHSVWGVVGAIQTRYGHGAPDVQNYVRRGKAGLVVLSWLADSLPAFSAGTRVMVALDHPVIAAAEEWLESSLAVRERGAHATTGG